MGGGGELADREGISVDTSVVTDATLTLIITPHPPPPPPLVLSPHLGSIPPEPTAGFIIHAKPTQPMRQNLYS